MIRAALRPAIGLLRSAFGTNGMAASLAAIDAKLDRLIPAASAPHSPPPPPGPAIDTNLMFHQSRGAMLREMPAGAKRLVSAGCAGAWYFDWVAQCYGPVPEHVGIEYYMPRPEHLPANVTWIENTASDMAALADASADLMISGQNIEHLWADEVAGFLVEAARVLQPGGTLAIDSPNRAMTAPLNWSHPEHTIELTPSEMADLLSLAGFRVTKRAGMWLCRDPRTGRMLPYDPNDPDTDWSIPERLVVARDHPEDSFLWWIEAVRTDAAPDRGGIDALLAGLYVHAWPERIRRMKVPPHQATETRADGEWVVARPGTDAVVLYGPYMPLRAGLYTVGFTLDAADAPADAGVCEVLAAGTVLCSRGIGRGDTRVNLSFDLPALQFGIEFRCHSRAGGFAVKRLVDFSTR